MLPPGLNTPREVKAFYDARYASLIDSGEYQPFLYPWATIGAGIILLYLLFDYRRSPTLQALRLPLYGLLCAFSGWCILTNKARSPPGAYGVGLVSAFGTLWCGAIMCFNDAQSDFKRIERADDRVYSSLQNLKPREPGSQGSSASRPLKDYEAKRVERDSAQGPSQRTGLLTWQSYPAGPFVERLDWVIDIFCSFRGVGWNIHTAGIPPLPDFVEAELNRTECKSSSPRVMTDSKTGVRRFADRTALLKHVGIRLVIGYFALDVLKTIMHHDAYFWGYMDAPPPHFLPQFARTSYPLVKSYRLLVSFAGVYTALSEIFWLGPLFFCGILGPSTIGVRGEPWMNPPDFFGNLQPIFVQGLGGLWGGFWHQTFRFAFEAPAKRLLELMGIEKKTNLGRTVSLFVAFFLSGCLHTCGSYTQLGDTQPLRGPMMFFLLQAMGIVAQTLVVNQLKLAGVSQMTPKTIRQFGNFAFTLIWMYFTANFLVDDFAIGGVWLFEPVIFSPLRFFGLGAKDDNGWDLWYKLVWWRNGDHWWDTGLAF